MHTMTLKHPITVDNITLHELTLRRPKVRDRLIVERSHTSDAEKEVALMANLAGTTKEMIEELDLGDYAALQEVLQGFLVASPLPKT